MPDNRAATPSLDSFAKQDEVPPTEFVKTYSDPTVATVAVVGIGAAVFEAALLPGLVLGVAATCVPRYFPQIGSRHCSRFSNPRYAAHSR